MHLQLLQVWKEEEVVVVEEEEEEWLKVLKSLKPNPGLCSNRVFLACFWV